MTARLRFVIALLIVAAAARFLTLQWLHPVTWDEIEFFRCTDWICHGLVPYRDFWEHHTPLLWFLFAPLSALTTSAGQYPMLLMRWGQVPLWMATFYLLTVWMRDLGISAIARWSAVLLALCSSMFMLASIEYRVDTLGCFLYVAALVCLQRMERSPAYGFAAGAALCLTGFANLRLGPLLAITVLLTRVVQPEARRWEGQKKANWTFVGIIAALAVALAYFAASRSATTAFRQVWIDNYLADRISPDTPWILPHRLLVLFGLHLLDYTNPQLINPTFDAQSIDLPSIAILGFGAVAVLRVLFTRFRAPDWWFVLAFLQVSSFVFIAAMKYIYHYHFEIVVLMMLPFIASEIDRLLERDRWRLVGTALVVATLVNVFACVFRGKEGDMAWQDFIMKEVNRATPPGSAVFDGVGRAIRRRPAYRYWFLPTLVKNLVAREIYAPYSLREMANDPPAAILTDYRAYLWLDTDRPLAAFARTHYLPAWCNLWLPGMSALVSPAKPAADWIVPATGTYRVYASERLATHPWFYEPLAVGSYPTSTRVEIALVGFTPPSKLPLSFSVDGRAVQPDQLPLVRKQHLRVVSLSAVPFGIMIVPTDITGLFRQPPPNVSLDGGLAPRTHVPHFWGGAISEPQTPTSSARPSMQGD